MRFLRKLYVRFIVFKMRQKFWGKYRSRIEAKQSYEKSLDVLLNSNGLREKLSETRLNSIKHMKVYSEEDAIIVLMAASLALLYLLKRQCMDI